MVQETGVQSLVESYQKLKKCYLIPPCLTLSIIRYVSRVKWRNLRKGVAPSLTPRCRSYWKGSLQVTFDYSRQLYFFLHSSVCEFIFERGFGLWIYVLGSRSSFLIFFFSELRFGFDSFVLCHVNQWGLSNVKTILEEVRPWYSITHCGKINRLITFSKVLE